MGDILNITAAFILVFLNGFFVAAEFALVKLTESKVRIMVQEKRKFANKAAWLFDRQNFALSTCQLGITVASLALGAIGEPAIHHMLTPVFESMSFIPESWRGGISFFIAISVITVFHIVIGEQVPKIYAIRKASFVFQWSAPLLKVFYIVLYPFMYILQVTSDKVLSWVGVNSHGGHDSPLSEEEIRASLSIAHRQGELTKNEHSLLNAVFKFDDQVARQIMLPRGDVEYLDANNSFKENLEFAMSARHTRFPLCDGSLDDVLGVIHIKDLLGASNQDNIDLNTLARKQMIVPENILIGDLLQEFKQARQHFAFVQDEHGTNLGIVTLEDVLEELVGPLQDEFDNEEPDITPQKENVFVVDGETSIDEINEKLILSLEAQDSDTISGLIVEKAGHKLEGISEIMIDKNVKAELLEIDGIRVTKAKLIILKK